MKIVYLDRDGVINRRLVGDYVKKWSEFRFLPYAKRAIRKLTQAGFQLYIVSNQQGVGKGIMTKQQLDEITRRMLAEIRKSGGKIHSVAYCLHTAAENCYCRKPNPGLLTQTSRQFKFRVSDCWMIGDDERDILAGVSVGCKTILIGTEKLKSITPTYRVQNLLAAANLIIKKANPNIDLPKVFGTEAKS